MTELEKLLKQTEQLWKQYVLGNDVEIVEGIREIFSPDCVIIGTGRHEVYIENMMTFTFNFGTFGVKECM